MLPIIASSANPIQVDRELAQAVLARDRKAAAEFVQRYSNLVHRFIYRRLYPQVDAVDDIVQDTIFAGWRGLSGYQGDSTLAHWLLSIARRKVADHFRQTLAQAISSLDAESEFDSHPDPKLLQDAEFSRLTAARRSARILSTLKPEYRIVLRWRYWDDCSTRQMAESLQRSEKSVERLLSRARKAFESQWKSVQGDSDAR
jgi:RNA polymerase sigma-70 factor (ECF subfamily)